MQTHGTINCLALDAAGRLAGVTTTSGLSWKLAGRVGDSPIIGAGLYVDNEIGAAGSTGRGEANLQTCASFRIVDAMGRGMSPEQACLEACKAVAAKTKLVPRLCDDKGRPKFGLDFYALNKKGRVRRGRPLPGRIVRGPRRGREQAPRGGLSFQKPGDGR